MTAQPSYSVLFIGHLHYGIDLIVNLLAQSEAVSTSREVERIYDTRGCDTCMHNTLTTAFLCSNLYICGEPSASLFY